MYFHKFVFTNKSVDALGNNAVTVELFLRLYFTVFAF